MPDKEIRLVQTTDASNVGEFSESRGKGLEMVSSEPAKGVTIVPDGSTSDQTSGPVVSASDAANGPPDFDG